MSTSEHIFFVVFGVGAVVEGALAVHHLTKQRWFDSGLSAMFMIWSLAWMGAQV